MKDHAMFEEPSSQSPASAAELQTRIDAVVAAGPLGAFALAGAGVAVVVAIWCCFYVWVYLARGGA